jgi:6-pyruvoyltetrahydropterin/6-carboxytetrahydropterin synthase
MSCVTVTKQYRTETAHRLLGYAGGCRFLHGHSYLWEVTAQAPVDPDSGLSVDFKDLKAAMTAVLEPMDHAVVLHQDDVLAQAIIGDAAALGAAAGRRIHLWPFNPTAENMAVWAGHNIQGHLKGVSKGPRVATKQDHWMKMKWDQIKGVSKGPRVVCVRVHETATSFAEAMAPFAFE